MVRRNRLDFVTVLSLACAPAVLCGCHDAPADRSPSAGDGPADAGPADSTDDTSADGTDPSPSQAPLCPGAITRALPIVVPGASVPSLLGLPVDRIAVFRWRDGWERVTSQVDERRALNAPEPTLFYVLEELDVPANATDVGFSALGQDDDPAFDANDEIAVPADAPGDQAPRGIALPDGAASPGVEVTAFDAIEGTTGFLYAFESAGSGPSFDPEVDYERSLCADSPEAFDGECAQSWAASLERTTVTTPCYGTRFTATWIMDELRVFDAQGGTGEDLIDQWKGRAGILKAHPSDGPYWPSGEVEDIGARVNATTGQMTWCGGWSTTNDTTHYYVGQTVGPVRAIRMVHGACSYTNLVRTTIFSRAAIEDRFWLRGHAISASQGGIAFYWDYSEAASPLEYTRVGLDAPVTFDGAVDFSAADGSAEVNGPVIAADALRTGIAEEVSSAAGGLLFFTQQTFGATDPALHEIVPYQLDDAAFDDGTGSEPGVIGGQGLRFRFIEATDDAPLGFTFVYRPTAALAPSSVEPFQEMMATPLEISSAAWP